LHDLVHVYIMRMTLLYVLNAVSGTNSHYPVTNKTLITIHRSDRDNEHKLFTNNTFKVCFITIHSVRILQLIMFPPLLQKAHLPVSGLADENPEHSPSMKTVALAYSIPVTLVPSLIGLVFLTVKLIRWMRIYRMTNRNRPVLRFTRNVAQKEFLTVNTDYLRMVDQVEQNVSSLSFLLMREWIELETEIGEGCFGKVFRGRLRRPDSSIQPTDPSYINLESSQAVAIKVLKSPSPGIASATAQRDFLREAETMASFSHENILALHGIVINGEFIKLKFFV